MGSAHNAILLVLQILLSGLGAYFLFVSIQYGELVGGFGAFIFVILVSILMFYVRKNDEFEAIEFQSKVVFTVKKRVVMLTQESVVRVICSPNDGLSTCEIEIDGSPLVLNSRIENLEQLVSAIRRIAKVVDDPSNFLCEL